MASILDRLLHQFAKSSEDATRQGGRMRYQDYQTEGFYDELFEAPGQPRPGARMLMELIERMPEGMLEYRQAEAEKALYDMGITFTVYGHEDGTEKIFPFDILPRIVEARDWARVDAGLRQRIEALNLFVQDVYNEQRILKDKVVPRELVESAAHYFPKQLGGVTPPAGVWCHVTGTDLVRDEKGELFVLEDNLRCPSGVSYVLANRQLLKRTFPQVFSASRVRPVNDYPARLLDTLLSLVPAHKAAGATVALLTPGVYNSAYFEHSFLALEMGVELVHGDDLVVQDGAVRMRTTKGLKPVDVIYRRINDDFLDPLAFRRDSLLGVPGVMEAFRAGKVALANAPGTGVADDKVIYAFAPKIIRYYLDQDAIIPNVPTYLCWDDTQLRHVLANMPTMVIKAANESGGYGMLVGPTSTRAEQLEFAEKVKANPRNYIAQPALSLSRAPVIVDDHLEGRHVDLRPYILYGADGISVIPGGLTRVALRKGSLVVNSSQGGGSKDTWVLPE